MTWQIRISVMSFQANVALAKGKSVKVN